ncbi:ROK family transcriptional regulator [Arthrobacter sulfonylureivorans]|uniref:ROK family transcriptional regulator n=1 Tax=Arthrobacter sulfonylureivorans TaxID=2486855 RepID=UPI0039E3988F
MQRGTNLGRLGGYNQAVILDAIRRAHEGIARVELVERTGLSPQTISNVVRRLVDEGLVREDRKTVSGPGKPRTVLQLEVSSRLAIGIHLDPVVMTLVMLNLDGEVVARARHDNPRAGQPDGMTAAMAAAVEELIAASGIERQRILGIGLAAPGPIDAAEGTVVDPPMMREWTSVPLREPLSRLTGLPVLMDKDTTAAAVAELWASGRQEPENFVFVYLGTGLGAGVVLDGVVLRGASSNIGEIGHFPVDAEVPQCDCGKRNCVGMALNFGTLFQQAVESGVFPPDAELGDRHQATERIITLCRMAVEGDSAAAAIINRAARLVGGTVAQLVNVLDVDRVIFGGPLWIGLENLVLPTLREEINSRFVSRAIHGVEVDSSSLGFEVGAIGGACLVLDDALSPKASGLLLGS